MPKKITSEIFIKKSKILHNNKYDYSLVNYTHSKTKVKIICPVHGVFEQKPNYHLSGNGCPTCSNNKKMTTDQFVIKSKEIHNNKYDYSLVNYINTDTKVKIICPIHGIFQQTPHHHLNRIKCPNCSHNKKITTLEFIQQSKQIHGNKYDYSLVKYNNSRTKKVKIICPIHGIFTQLPYEHKKGSGCPICNESKGEREIRNILEQNNILFETQKYLNGCKYKNKLKFDFYLPDQNICIEFDGEQHFEKFRFEKNNNGLLIRQKRDKIKNEYCKNNNIRLIRIKYDDNLKLKLNSLFNSQNFFT